jgi:hypothetical protein
MGAVNCLVLKFDKEAHLKVRSSREIMILINEESLFILLSKPSTNPNFILPRNQSK